MNAILSFVLVFFSVTSGSLVAPDYFPLKPGNKWYYEWGRSEIVLEVESKSYQYNGNTYWAMIDSTPEVAFDSSKIVFEGKTYYIYQMAREGMPIATMFYRKDAKGNLYWYDDESETESLVIPSEIKESQTWMSGDDRLEFKIVSTRGTFESKFSAFKDCLVISTKVLKTRYPGTSPEPWAVNFSYYCEGIGYVGSKPENKSGMTLLKWEISNAR
jgi:hypothetical protein